MVKTDLDEAQTELTRAIQKDAPCTFDEPIPVLVTLDNGVKYEGVAFEVQPESNNFPRGLVMVRTGNTDIGVPVNYIRGR
ncbi:MAG TPA: hypothetical protein VIS57_00620 [Xanthomonadales bacterium]